MVPNCRLPPTPLRDEMAAKHPPVNSFVRIDKQELQVLIEVLQAQGYRTVGPRVVDAAVVYRDLDSADQLPKGYVDRQDGGSYWLDTTRRRGPLRLRRRAGVVEEVLVSAARNAAGEHSPERQMGDDAAGPSTRRHWR